ncbi:Ubiquitin thioesterase otubain-like [Nosema granulosis]|uniref:ubiquitinyl hydrolase 1 n=1 Tax=Nosema granulosis TaxID=83296 RepID=A0A9P6GWS1_9MICR|nr:Ubiquitin thioesterase otubain-like [Nosema granulosis]
MSKEEEKSVSERREISRNRCYEEENFRLRFEKTNIKQYRDILRDGNCMYLSIGVQLIDKLQSDINFRRLFKDTLEEVKKKFKAIGLEEFTYVDYLSTLEENIDVPIQDIDKYCWYEIVGLLRLITSTELRTNQEAYSPYMVDTTVERYCKLNVDPFFVEAGYLEIGALVNILPIQIVVFDITEDSQEYSRVYGTKGENINILHTPNHFEPCY